MNVCACVCTDYIFFHLFSALISDLQFTCIISAGFLKKEPSHPFVSSYHSYSAYSLH